MKRIGVLALGFLWGISAAASDCPSFSGTFKCQFNSESVQIRISTAPSGSPQKAYEIEVDYDPILRIHVVADSQWHKTDKGKTLGFCGDAGELIFSDDEDDYKSLITFLSDGPDSLVIQEDDSGRIAEYRCERATP